MISKKTKSISNLKQVKITILLILVLSSNFALLSVLQSSDKSKNSPEFDLTEKKSEDLINLKLSASNSYYVDDIT